MTKEIIKSEIGINGKTATIEYGHKLSELPADNELWDFSIEDFLFGALDPNEEMLYWFIDGRVYEIKPLEE